MRSKEKLKKIIANPKVIAIIGIILILIPIFFITYANIVESKIRIGIVLTTPKVYDDAEVAESALNDFYDLFEAEIVEELFNESDVRIKDGLHLTDDYFDAEFADKIRDKNNVDIIMILTDRTINNWLGNKRGYWGEANLENSMFVATAAYFNDDNETHERFIKHTAIHETLHILGYLHTDPKECIMEYATLNTELCKENELELQYRAKIWQLGAGHESGKGMFIINLVLYSIFSLPFLALIIISNYLFRKKLYKKDFINPNPLIFGIGLSFINVLLISALIPTLYPRLISMISIVFLYIIIETFYFDKSTKTENQEKKILIQKLANPQKNTVLERKEIIDEKRVIKDLEKNLKTRKQRRILSQRKI